MDTIRFADHRFGDRMTAFEQGPTLANRDLRPGFFTVRMVRNGPLCGALVYMPCPWVQPDIDIHPDLWCLPQDRSRPLVAIIAGKPVDLLRVWTYGRLVSADEYAYRMAVLEWSRREAPDSPEANPDKAVDLRSAPPPF